MYQIKLYTLGILLCTTVFVWYVVFTVQHPLLTVAFLDIGQGDSIFIESPAGNQVLIDGGRNGKVLQELGRLMPFYDRSIDVVIATHPDSDHIGGLPLVLENYDVGVIFEPGVKAETETYKELERVIDEKGIKKILARRGTTIDLGEGVRVDILFPDQDVNGWETNRASIVARLVYGDTSVILTGDSPQEIEKQLVAFYGNSLKSTILKAGHHGSKTSSSRGFVSAVSPEYAIISAGKDNSYGHPHQEVMDLFREFNIQTLITFDLGTIKFTSNGKRWDF